MPHPAAEPPRPRSHPYPRGDAADPPFRLAGLHRADGLTGPPRRYLLVVALLAGAASLPLIAAVAAGPGAGGRSALGDITPFLGPPSGGPVIVPLPPASGLGDLSVRPEGTVLPAAPLPAIGWAAEGSVGNSVRAPARAATGAAVQAWWEGGTGRFPALVPQPIYNRWRAAGLPPTRSSDSGPTAKADRRMDRHAALARGKACRSAPRADRDREGVGGASSRGSDGRPDRPTRPTPTRKAADA